MSEYRPRIGPASRRNEATIVDVAREAGVAIGTVSRYLNGQSVRDSNRVLIERAVSTLGYTRNAVAASMKTDTTHIVGMMLPSISEFHGKLLEDLSYQLRQTGRAVLSFCHNLDQHSLDEGIDFFAAQRVDALVVDGIELLRPALERFAETGRAIVLYDNDLPGLLADRVFSDNRGSSERGVRLLAEMGHRRIATIRGKMRDSAGRMRLEGYYDALKSAGIPIEPELVVPGQWKIAGGHAAMERLFALDEPPTAVFGANYNVTIGALAWLKERGMRVPDDISLVSFDDVHAFDIRETGITALRQRTESLAAEITQLIDQRLAEPERDRRTVQVECELINRQSASHLATRQKVMMGEGL